MKIQLKTISIKGDENANDRRLFTKLGHEECEVCEIYLLHQEEGHEENHPDCNLYQNHAVHVEKGSLVARRGMKPKSRKLATYRKH